MPIVFRDVFELQDPEEAGFFGAFDADTSVVRQFEGSGGARSLRLLNSGSRSTTGPNFDQDYNHLHVKSGSYRFELNVDWELYFKDSGGTTIWAIKMQASTIKAYRGGTLIEDSGVNMAVARWELVEIEQYTHASAGWFRVWLDNMQIIDFTGNTGSASVRTITFEGRNFPRWDDIGINSIALQYKTGISGLPVAGEVLTEAVTGAVAVITSVTGDAVSGILVLEGYDEALGDVWADGNQITTTGTFDAQVDAPNAAFVNGLMPDSGRIGNSFHNGYLPDGNGASSGLTGSDGNSVDNYQLVASRADTGSPSTYVNASLANQQDTYLDSTLGGDIPAGSTIRSVGIVVFAQTALSGIDGIEAIVRIGGTDYYSARESLTTGYSSKSFYFSTDPSIASGSDQSWSLGTLTNVTFEYGQRFVV